MNLEDKEDIPVIDAFSTKGRREIIAYALTELTHDDWVRSGEITDNVDVGRETVRKDTKPLVTYGVLDVKDPDANIPHYRLADTPVVAALRDWDGYPLTELFAFEGRTRLVRYFLTKANPEESYSMNGIERESGIKASTVSNHIDVLVDAGLVTEVEGTRSTEYQLDADSDLYVYMNVLNDALYETFQARQ